MQKISVITVGGTIDKIYFDAKSEYEVGPPNIESVLDELNLSIHYSITSLLRKDSLDMTDEDRALIYETVKNDSSDKILITHGTDTMVKTARYLAPIKARPLYSRVPFNLPSSKPAMLFLISAAQLERCRF